MKASVGIDCGSATCKGVLLTGGAITSYGVKPTGWSPRATAGEVLETLLAESGLAREEVSITVTGYGRVGIPFADKVVTEITCHARGAQYIRPGVCTVIDIGGQDSKVIAVEGGKVQAFQMNDKCAAGTGRFVEMSAHRMGLDLAEFAALLQAGESCALSSMCAVFADSEIVSLLAAGKSREEVAGGVANAVAARAAALAAKIDMRPPVLLTGGLAEMAGLQTALQKQLGIKVESTAWSRYAGALGAAVLNTLT